MKSTIILFLISIIIPIKLNAQKIIKIKHPYVLISCNKGKIGKLNDNLIVYRKKNNNDIKIGKVKIVKFRNEKMAAKILKENQKIMIGDFVKKNYEHRHQFAVLIEIDPKVIFGVKCFLCKKQGFFLGCKFNSHTPEGKKYNWSQNRAETFYKSEFTGYSKNQYYGFNIGYVYMILNEKLFLYSGIGLLQTVRFRQYYDNTFTKWSKNYYITDGSISKTDIDLLLGTYFKFQSWVISFGYNTGSSAIVFGLGYSSNFSRLYY